MIKIVKAEFGRLERVTDSQGNIRKDWRASYIGDGLIVWFELSEGGEIHQFIRFYINEPTEIMQRHLTTSKIIKQSNGGEIISCVTKNSIYNFNHAYGMCKLEAEALIVNVWHELYEVGDWDSLMKKVPLQEVFHLNNEVVYIKHESLGEWLDIADGVYAVYDINHLHLEKSDDWLDCDDYENTWVVYRFDILEKNQAERGEH